MSPHDLEIACAVAWFFQETGDPVVQCSGCSGFEIVQNLLSFESLPLHVSGQIAFGIALHATHKFFKKPGLGIFGRLWRAIERVDASCADTNVFRLESKRFEFVQADAAGWHG